MSYSYILTYLLTDGVPPSGAMLHKNNQSGYFFAPISHEKDIFTIDSMIWKAANINTDVEQQLPMLESPASIEKKFLDGKILLFSLIKEKSFIPLGAKVPLPLEKYSLLDDRFIYLGFDVIDCYTGISALVNVGYNVQEIKTIKENEFRTNSFGLMNDETQAEKFAELASEFSPEHAPFVPTKIVSHCPARMSKRRIGWIEQSFLVP